MPENQDAADAVIAVMDETIDIAAAKWRWFCDQVPFKPEVGLRSRIWAFATPFMAGAREHVPALANAPDGLLLMFIAMGVERSGTHTRPEIEQALGARLPG